MLKKAEQTLQERWKTACEYDQKLYHEAMRVCVERVRNNIFIIGAASPASIAAEGKYDLIENKTWTTGFYPGMLWIAYAVTGDPCFLEAGKVQTKSFLNRYEADCAMDNHDLGFCYTLSAVADYRMTGDESAKLLAINAAYKMSELYMHKAGVINRGGGYSTKDTETEMFIIDCMNNIPLLFWASEVTGDRVLYEIAYNHAKNSTQQLIYPSGAVCHVGIAEIRTGKLYRNIEISQGKGGEGAVWSRAQAWAVAGLPITYSYTGDEQFLEAARRTAKFFLNSMPEDRIAPWDLYYRDNEVQKDTSASAIAVCGLLELRKYVTEEEAEICFDAAVNIMNRLINKYLISSEKDSMGMLSGGTYTYLAGQGVNVPNIFGDYYFMEALFRLTDEYKRFW